MLSINKGKNWCYCCVYPLLLCTNSSNSWIIVTQILGQAAAAPIHLQYDVLKVSVAQTIQILYWAPSLCHTRELSVWAAVLPHATAWALTCHWWQGAGFLLPFKSPGFMVLFSSRFGCPEIECLCWICFSTSEGKVCPQESRGSVSHPCCLLCSAVKEEKLALGSCRGSPKSSASQAPWAAPFTFGNWAIKDFVF